MSWNNVPNLKWNFKSFGTNVKAANVKCNVSLQDCVCRSWICDYLKTISRTSQQKSEQIRMTFVKVRASPTWDLTGPSTFSIHITGTLLHTYKWSHSEQAAPKFSFLFFFLLLFYPVVTFGWVLHTFPCSTCNYEV